MSQAFEQYSNYYDLLYKDKNYEAESEYIFNLIKAYHPKATTIIEFGSGTGKHAKLLAENGFKLLGIEPSATMLAFATHQPHKNVTFQQADTLTFNTEDKFDVALSLFHVISYVNDNAALIATFKKINNSLTSNGVFIFDVWYTSAVISQVPEKRTKVIENDLLRITRNANPAIHWNEHIVDVNYDIHVLDKVTGLTTQTSEKHSMRHFSIPEIGLLAAATGFEVLRSEAFLSGNIPGPDTWGVCFILKKQSL